MQDSAKGMARGLILSSSALLLAACGGGGGGDGGIPGGPAPANPYEVRLSASRSEIPLNLNNNPCVNPPTYSAPSATTLFVEAVRRGTNDPIPGGEDVISCNVMSGLESGSLYYFRGDDDDKVEVDCGGEEPLEIEGSFRSILLGANAGGSSFHVLGRDKVGTVVVRCSVTDPQSNTQAYSDISIRVGGVASGKPSQVVVNSVAPNFLVRQGDQGPTQRVLQARIVDEAGQPVPNPAGGVHNLAARIIDDPADPAENDALLRSGAQSGAFVTTSSVNGQAQFSVISGTRVGKIAVEIVADRADNNVMNGIAQPIRNIVKLDVVDASVYAEPLRITTPEALPTAFESTPYSAFLESSGGTPPFTWSLLPGDRLPSGLTLSTSGVISGEAREVGTGFRFAAQVRDSNGAGGQKAFSIDVEAQAFALLIETDSLPDAYARQFYAATLNAVGGSKPYSWSVVGLPAGLSFDPVAGIISGTPTNGGTFSFVATVRDSRGRTASQTIGLEIGGAAGGTDDPADTTPPSLVFSIPASGQNNVDRSADIVMRFSEPLDEATMSTASVSVRRAGGNVLEGVYGGVQKVDDLTYRLVQYIGSALLPVNAQLELVLSDSIRDLAGNQLAQTVVPFSTGGELDITPPQVAFTIPGNGAVDVSPTGTITVVFNEAMDPDSIAPQSFAVYRITGFGGSMQDLGSEGPPTLPTATAIIAESDRAFSFIAQDSAPGAAGNLIPGQHYRVVMSVSPRDMAGNQICSTSGACGTPTAPVEGATPSYSFEFRVGDQ